MRPFRLLTTLLALTSLGAGPAPRKIPADPREAKVREVRLDNGLRVLLFENHLAPVVSVWSWYRVGSQNENAGVTGMAHLVEHMTFEGTDEIPAAEMKGIVERAGGDWNGYTWLDQTAFFETAPASALESLLGLESQRMGKATFPESAMEPVRNTVLGELDAGNADPAEALDQEVVSAAFKTHPYRTPTIGWRADVSALSREDALAFYKQWYVPSAATLVVVGDFKTSDALKLVHAKFDGLSQGNAPSEEAAAEPPQEGERRVTLTRPAPARQLEVAYRAPAAGDPDFASFLVVDAILAGAKGANLWSVADREAPRGTRLYRALIPGGLATSARSGFLPTRASYLEALRVTVSDGVEAQKVEDAAINAAESLGTTATTADVERAKKQLIAKLTFESASDTDLGHQLGFFQTLDPSGTGWRRAWRLPVEIDRVTTDDVRRVAAKWLVPGGRTVGWLTPPPPAVPAKPSATPTPSKGAAKTWKPRNAAEGASEATPAPVKRPRPPPPPPAFGPLPVRQVLPNGVVVLAVRNPLAAEVEVRVDIAAGGERDNPEKAGSAALCARLLPSGGGGHGELAVADAFADAGATLDSLADAERVTVRSRMLAASFETLLPIVKEMVVSPSFPKESFDREKSAAIADAKARETDPVTVAELALRATIYPPTDPRACDPLGSVRTLDALARVDLAEFHRRFYRPDATIITVSGDVDPQTAIRAVKKSFGAWKVLAPAPPKVPLAAAPDVAPGTGLTRVPVATNESALVLGSAGIARGDHDAAALAAVIRTLEQRLAKALQVDTSLARFVSVDAAGVLRPGPFLIEEDVTAVSGEPALLATRDVVAALAKDGVTEPELALAKAKLLGRLARSLETNAALAASLADAERFGEGADGVRAQAARLQAITLEDTARAASAYLPATGPAVLAGPKK